MPPPVNPSWFDLHQTFVGSLIVFLGVIVGLVGNGILQRWDRNSKRDHDRKVMSSALLAELTFLRNSYESRVQAMATKPGTFDLPMTTETEVYDKLLDKIGVLNPEQGSKVIHAYLAAKHLSMDVQWIVVETPIPRVMKLMGIEVPRSELLPDEIEGLTKAPHEGQIRVPPWTMGEAVRLHRERIDLFKAAIDALTKA